MFQLICIIMNDLLRQDCIWIILRQKLEYLFGSALKLLSGIRIPGWG